MLLVGGAYLVYLLKFQRDVLEHEPGQGDVAVGAEGDSATEPVLDPRKELALV
jgi:hypothetical protein